MLASPKYKIYSHQKANYQIFRNFAKTIIFHSTIGSASLKLPKRNPSIKRENLIFAFYPLKRFLISKCSWQNVEIVNLPPIHTIDLLTSLLVIFRCYWQVTILWFHDGISGIKCLQKRVNQSMSTGKMLWRETLAITGDI